MHTGSAAGSDTAVNSCEDVDQASIFADTVDYGSVHAETVSRTPVKSRPLFSVRKDEDRPDSTQAAATAVSSAGQQITVPRGFDGTSSHRGIGSN